MVCKQTGGKFLQMKRIFFELMIWKQTGGGILQMKDIFFTLLDIFFTFSVHAMQIYRCENFKERGYRFDINSFLVKKWLSFTDDGHLFYIQPQCYANKHVTKF